MSNEKNFDAEHKLSKYLHEYFEEGASPAYHEVATNTDYVQVNQSLAQINKKLNTFVRPTAYDGSGTIQRSLSKVSATLIEEITQHYSDYIPAHVQDIKNRLLESVYFHYKYAQRNAMKITSLLQKTLIDLLNISHDDLAASLKEQYTLAKHGLSKTSLLVIVKDNLIQACFWQAAGPEAHISLKLLDAKLYCARPENRFVRRQIVEMHQHGQQKKLLELTERVSEIRVNRDLSDYQRHQALVSLCREFQSKSIGGFANKFDSLLIEAEKHINDYFDVAMVRC